MGFSFVLEEDTTPRGPSEEELDIAGEDISLEGGDFTETASGDLATLTGVQCAKQSAVRETLNNPGSFARRPQWGAGVAGLIMKSSTSAVRDRIVSRTKARLLVNPRITKVHEVSATYDEEADATRITLRCDAVGGRLDATVLVKPPGVD